MRPAHQTDHTYPDAAVRSPESWRTPMNDYPNRRGSIVPLKHDEAEAARHLLYAEGLEGGYAPGSFSAALIRAFQCADLFNRQRLMRAFPAYARPVAVMTTVGGKALQRLLEHPSEGLEVHVNDGVSDRTAERAAEVLDAAKKARPHEEDVAKDDEALELYEELAIARGRELAEAYLDLHQRATALGVLQ